MILVRDIFHLKFGKAKDAKAVFKEGLTLNQKLFHYSKGRLLSDISGDSYRIIFEHEWTSLSEWENAIKGLSSDEWQKWYQKVIPLVENASRDFLTIVE